MFPTMSPKSLNVEKLEKKFASLTKSKESIQGLSMWIIRHKEFYKEIVNQWFDALTRGFGKALNSNFSENSNALNMFYVANDVIQNCGRKKAPEFREAFATVLEQACSLEKVKEIKNEVMRMLTLWHERSIYNDVFYKKLVDALNSENELESENEELDEADVIANFKLENLINSLKKLKTLEDELSLKEAFLEDIEEPVITNIDNLIVKMESQKELKKVDKFQKLVEDYLSLSDKVMLAKKSALLNLNYSTIFYNAQFRDADKVAQAYRIYGKKVNNVKKSLDEKMLTFPEPSPVAEEEIPEAELSLGAIHIFPDVLQMSAINNNLKESYLQEKHSPKNSENNMVLSSSNDKCETIPEKRISPSPSNNSSKNLNENLKPLKSPVLEAAKSSKSDRHNSSKNLNENLKPLKSPVLEAAKSSKSDRHNSSKNLNEHLKPLKSPVLEAAKSSKSDRNNPSKNLNEHLKPLKSPVLEATKSSKSDRNNSSKNLNEHLKPLKSPVLEAAKSSRSDRSNSSKNLNEHLKPLKSPVLETAKSSRSDRKQLLSPSISDIPKINENVLKSPIFSGGEKNPEMLLKSPTINDVKKSSTTNILKSPSEINIAKSSHNENKFKCLSVDKSEKSTKQKEKCLKESVSEDFFMSGNDEKKPAKVLNIEHYMSSDDDLNISESRENSSSAKNKSDSDSKKTDSEEYQGLSDFENIDFLLEKAYDERRSKSKLSIKRKIDNLLKSKQSKACKLSTEEDTGNKSVSNSSVSETPMDIEPCLVSDVSNLNEKICDELKPVMKDCDSSSEAGNINTNEKLDKETDLKEPKDQDLNQSIDISKPVKSLDSETSKSVPLPFQALSDIPTELLKNILDKHRTNLNTSMNIESDTSANESSDFSVTNINQPALAQNNTDDLFKSKITDSSLQMATSDTEVSKIEDSNKNSQEMLVENIKKCDLVGDTGATHDKNKKIKSTLLDNLQDILKCFTQKESRFGELKNSKTLNNMPSLPLENTLKVYSYIMQSCNNGNSLGSSKDSDKAPPLNTSPVEAASVDKDLSNVNYQQVKDCFDPKSENLEIMDMEIDSEDENS